MPNTVHAFAPATVSNVACGFDIFGFPLDSPGDEVIATLSSALGVQIKKITGDGGRLPREADKNTAGVAVLSLLKRLGITQGVELELKKNLPLGSGLGSSAASAVAAVVACNKLLGEKLSPRELLPFVLDAERVACGAGHADNAAPALLGGFIIIRSYTPLDVIKIPVPESLCCAVVHPHHEVQTAEARKILRAEVALKDMVAQTGNAAALVAGIMSGDLALVGRALVDSVIEPQRAMLIPAFYQVKEAALAAGALGCSISGSGPSIFALCDGLGSAHKAGAAMRAALKRANVESDLFISSVNTAGSRILS